MKNSNEFLRSFPAPIGDEKRPTEEGLSTQVISIQDQQRIKSDGQPFLSESQREDLRQRWTTVQAGFVDEPRQAVHDADELVTSAIQQVSEMFRAQRFKIENQWSEGSDASTEDLRVCLQQYREFFNHLLSI